MTGERAYLKQFNDLGQAKSHLRAVTAEGNSISTPTPIQDDAIPAVRADGRVQHQADATKRTSTAKTRRSGSARRPVQKNARRPDLSGERKPGPDAMDAGLFRMLGNIGAVTPAVPA